MFAEKSRSNMNSWIQRFMSFIRELRLSAEIWKIEKIQSYIKWLHCRQGFHYWRPTNIDWNGTKFAYLECPFCGIRFFANVKEKKKYLKYLKEDKRNMESWK